MKKKIIKNAKSIVTCDAKDNVYENCDILINGQAIEKIGKDIDIGEAEVISGKDLIIYPGLINTHHHFFQTFVRNLITVDYPNLTVVDWLKKIYPIFALVDADVMYYSSLTAMADLIKHGCTCAFDHQYCYTKKSGKSMVDRQMEAAKMLGIRYHAGRGANSLPMSEGSTIPDEMVETTDEFLKDCERLINLYHDPEPFSMARIVVAPCQPINSYIETFKESISLARTKGVYLHTHLGEGENFIMQERWGKRTLEWCEDIGFIGPDVWFAHGWELEPREYGPLAKSGAGVSHCPAPATLGGFNILDFKAMQEAGVPLSLGCDGSATNDGSSLLDTLRMTFLMQAYHSKARGGCVSPYDVLKVATNGGAKALGRDDLGSLAPGKAADLFAADAGVLELAGALHDPRNMLARAGVTGNVAMTMIGGKVVYKDGMLQGVDERKLAEEGEKVCSRVLRMPCEAFHGLF